ncbi:MAG: hypothetical protein WEC84_04670 [Candidatus Andersenbacteria bacterium]
MNKNLDPNSPGYTNAILEDVNDKFQVLVEGQSSINERLDRNTELLNTTFEEVGKLRVDVDALKIGFTDLKKETGGLKQETKELREEMHGLKGEVKELKEEVRDNKVRIDKVESR